MPFVAVLTPLAFHLQGVYRLRRGRSRVDDFFAVFIGSILAVVLGVVSTLYFQAYYASDEARASGAYEVSQLVWALFLALNVLFTYASRETVRELLERRWRAGIGLKRILIAGTGDLGRQVAERMLQHRELGYQVVGFVDDSAGGDHLGYRGLPLLGTLADVADVARRERVDHLYVALPLDEHAKLLDLMDLASREFIDVRVVPDLLQFIALRASLEDLDGLPVINPNDTPLQGVHAWVKRGLDVACLGVALVLLAIPMADHGRAGAADLAGTGLLHPGADGAGRPGLHGLQVPLDVSERRGHVGPDLGARRRPAHDAGGPLAAPPGPRRAAAALERAQGRDVARRPAARAAVLRGAVQAPHPAVHAAPQGEGRASRAGRRSTAGAATRRSRSGSSTTCTTSRTGR